ncbi:MAG: RagB/SusD family nutrient uptake outer membrane protein [Spirosomataceae bacterium]
MFRADVYLMQAEAFLQSNNAAEALTAINAVRFRAGWPGKRKQC